VDERGGAGLVGSTVRETRSLMRCHLVPHFGHVPVARLTAADIDFFTYLHPAVMTGARRSQLLALRWSDVDVHHAVIGFCRALVDGPTGPVLGPTKNRRTYGVALDPISVELLLAHRDDAPRTAGVVDGFVFSRDAGRHPWRPNWVTKRFIAYRRRRAGLAAFGLHDLRHFMAATTMLAAGVPVPVVSERLCHARTAATVNIDVHAMPGGDRAAVDPAGRTPHPSPRPSCRPSRANRRPRARPVARTGRVPCRPQAHALSCSRLQTCSTGPSGVCPTPI
jgi:hypothetical protein